MGGRRRAEQPQFFTPPWQQDLVNKAQAGYGQQQQQFQQLQNMLNPIAQGQNLFGGEGFNRALQAAENRIIPQIESRFNRGGRFGSGLARQAEASAIGDAFANLYGNERQLQQQAIQQMGALANQPLQNYASVLGSIPTPRPVFPGSGSAGFLGGALGGGKLGSTFGPLGAGLGALAGGLAGRYL